MATNMKKKVEVKKEKLECIQSQEKPFVMDDIIEALNRSSSEGEDNDLKEGTSKDKREDVDFQRSLEDDVEPLPSPTYDCQIFIYKSVNDVSNDFTFDQSISFMYARKEIGVEAFSETRCRNSPIDIIAFSTYNEKPSIFVYILKEDRVNGVSKMAISLREILLTTDVTKICVETTMLSDMISHRLGVDLPEDGEVIDIQTLDQSLKRKEAIRRLAPSMAHKIPKEFHDRDLADIIMDRFKLLEIKDSSYYKDYRSDQEYQVFLSNNVSNAGINFLKRKMLFLIPAYHEMIKMFFQEIITTTKEKIHDRRDLTHMQHKQRLLRDALGITQRHTFRVDDEKRKQEIQCITEALKPIQANGVHSLLYPPRHENFAQPVSSYQNESISSKVKNAVPKRLPSIFSSDTAVNYTALKLAYEKESRVRDWLDKSPAITEAHPAEQVNHGDQLPSFEFSSFSSILRESILEDNISTCSLTIGIAQTPRSTYKAVPAGAEATAYKNRTSMEFACRE
jgi:hypothetical protein